MALVKGRTLEELDQERSSLRWLMRGGISPLLRGLIERPLEEWEIRAYYYVVESQYKNFAYLRLSYGIYCQWARFGRCPM